MRMSLRANRRCDSAYILATWAERFRCTSGSRFHLLEGEGE